MSKQFDWIIFEFLNGSYCEHNGHYKLNQENIACVLFHSSILNDVIHSTPSSPSEAGSTIHFMGVAKNSYEGLEKIPDV